MEQNNEPGRPVSRMVPVIGEIGAGDLVTFYEGPPTDFVEVPAHDIPANDR